MCHFRVPKLLSDMPQSVGGWDFASDPTGGAYSAPQDPISGPKGVLPLTRLGWGRERGKRGKEG